MTAQITTLTIKDGAGADRTVQAVDLSGTGAGPWSFLHGLVDAGGTPLSAANPLAVAATALPLPTGAATAANQATEISGLASILAACLASTPAGEAHIGAVGGDVAKAAVTFGPTASTTYTTGQVLLAATEITNAGRVAGGTGLVTSLGLALAVANTVQVDAIVFSSQPSGTYAAGATFGLAAADLAKVSKVFHLTDWTALGTAACWGQAPAETRFYKCDDATKTQSLWVLLVARGSITLASATDATLSLRLSRN